MKKRKKKNAITLLALVITIVIMLLLAGVAIQMIMGENGLIAKSVQAQKEQAKAELYDTAKLSYMSLNAKALENGQSSPQTELALSTTEFTNKYSVVGDDITDKKGTVIESKLKLINELNELRVISEEPEISMKGEYIERPWPKKVSGVTIPEEDKDKMILKIKILKDNKKIEIMNSYMSTVTCTVEYGNGKEKKISPMMSEELEYNKGEHIVKIEKPSEMFISTGDDVEVEILQWGKIEYIEDASTNIHIANVSAIYEPEPERGRLIVHFRNGKMSQIPEWLYSKKNDSEYIEDQFENCNNLTQIPENLFKHNTNVEIISVAFMCEGLTSIPENLFKYNLKLKQMSVTFSTSSVAQIPENLFKYNTELEIISGTFLTCRSITSIPENLFKYNLKLKQIYDIFAGCSSITSIPENLFKHNTELEEIRNAFFMCEGLTSIPENLFKYNTKLKSFEFVFKNCTGLTSIPENLFKYNNNVKEAQRLFEGCENINDIPEKIIEFANKVKERTESPINIYHIFAGCTSASNYSSLPAYMK